MAKQTSKPQSTKRCYWMCGQPATTQAVNHMGTVVDGCARCAQHYGSPVIRTLRPQYIVGPVR